MSRLAIKIFAIHYTPQNLKLLLCLQGGGSRFNSVPVEIYQFRFIRIPTILIIQVYQSFKDSPFLLWFQCSKFESFFVFAPKANQLGGGFKDFLFSPLPGEMIHFDKYFSKGLKPSPSQKSAQKWVESSSGFRRASAL